MSLTAKVLALMSDGKSRSVNEVAAITGMTVAQARNTLAKLNAAESVVICPASYAITPAGASRKEEADRIAALGRRRRKTELEVERRRRANLKLRLEQQETRYGSWPKDWTVEKTVQSVPNSVFALAGGAHA